MKLNELLKNLTAEAICGSTDVDAEGIITSTANVTPGCCFVCIKGFNVDGHTFAEEAAGKGAVVIVMEDRAVFASFTKKHEAE
ncbi:MAG: hypothetical protein J5921_02765, partial [Clostridia bacterium]|nr:hypothetical protein [Clostridia bacterium]